MRGLCVSLLLFFATIYNFLEVDCTDRTYYWRDFDGLVPWDAFPGGQDQNGQPIYIGQALYGATLLPAKIYTNDNRAYYTWGAEVSSTENIKILCSRNPQHLGWVSTTKDGLHSLINKFLIKGGYEAYYDLYIGRAFHKGQTLVGRIRAGATAGLNLGLYVSVPQKEVILDSFEILTYDAEGNSTDLSRCSKDLLVVKS